MVPSNRGDWTAAGKAIKHHENYAVKKEKRQKVARGS